MWHRPKLATWVKLTLGAGIRHKLEGKTAQLPLPVHPVDSAPTHARACT